MFKSYLKIFLRNIWNHTGYSSSNILGLAVGMSACFLILLFVRYELNWNKSNNNFERIYQVQQKILFKNEYSIHMQTGYSLASELKNQVPEIENAATLWLVFGDYLSSSEKLTFNEKNGMYAESDIFKVLTFEFVEGNPENALTEPFSVVLTLETANKYFPGENAMGRIIKSAKNKSLRVTGIVKNLPHDLNHRPDYIVSFSTYKETGGWKDFNKIENIASSNFYTVVILKPGASAQEVNKKIYDFNDKYVFNNIKKLYLKPLKDLHLLPREDNDLMIAIYYIGGFAIFVLILACINFINLLTANSFLRKKEIGIRKVVGGSRVAIFIQFIGESLFTAFIAIVISASLVALLLPSFNTLVERQIDINFSRDYGFILYMIFAFLATGFISGLYPALYLSGFQPLNIIKGNISLLKQNRTGSSKGFLRKTLVTFQFCISSFLLIETIFVVKQISYMSNKELGFEKRNLIIVNVYGTRNEGKFETLRNELLKNPKILNAAISRNAPFHGNWGKEINWEGASSADKLEFKYNKIDYNFINTYKMKIVLGRNFSNQFITDSSACLINETAWKTLNWKNPIGKTIDNNRYRIIGVVKDYNPYSVHEKIPSIYLTLNSGSLKEDGVFTIRIEPGENEKTSADIRSQFRRFFPDALIEVVSFENDFDIGTEGAWKIVEHVFIMFAIIALLLAANGLFGMVSFSSQRRIKEIGIRKVFGASALQIHKMMSRELMRILIISTLIALPFGYYLSTTSPGACKYQLQITDYILCVGLMFFTALLASIYHVIKAVLSNPVETLRYE